jgi:antitoxin PrlF
MSRMTSKGQVTIPKKVRDYLGLKPGEEVEFEFVGDGRVAVKPGEDFETRVQREQHRMERALASVRGTLKLGMTTDEFMRFVRGDPEE